MIGEANHEERRRTIQSHRDLLVWQKGIDLVEEVYRLSETFPRREAFVLTSQLARAAISIPSNIAEGRGRFSRKDFANFVSIAKGSAMECESLLIVAVRLRYLTTNEASKAMNLTEELAKMLSALHRHLNRSRNLQ